ncbi:PREDICTED: probable palmitoyltransferase ZDHHC12 isoform X3 [Theobroma cacao]|uniref:S-acyltransferase n=2 Tax=Theobroma cacao TaxID=3641 RepID=A0AB32USU2_THECC|nr:PREDICTED: probable palmitoyltransferase ZDHHC12 isoform X3 [Theobroma cacao]
MGLLQLHGQRKVIGWQTLIGRCTISCFSVLITQSALFLVPLFFAASPILIQLTISALVFLAVVGFGGWCRRLHGFHASAPAFVFFNIFFFWGVYIAIVRQAISRFVDIVLNIEMIMLIIGLFRIMVKDPGFVAQESVCLDKLDESSVLGVQTNNESSLLQMRVRYCKSCKTYVQGFDHHCPAFGNCIGQKNYVFFMVLLVGFITTETFYAVCSSQFATKFPVLEGNMLEGLFLIWHVYCICFNIRTEEWVNWKKYPEFQLNASSLPGENYHELRFTNPYDKGILQNVKEFLTLK